MINYEPERTKQMDGKYIVVKANGQIEIGEGSGDVPLEFMQKKVGGYIERIPLPYESSVDLWCDEEGLFKDYQKNVIVSDYLNHIWKCGNYYNIMGDVLILAHEAEDSEWLKDDEADRLFKMLTGLQIRK